MLGAFFIYYTRVRRPARYTDIRSGQQVTQVRYSLVAFICLVAQMSCFASIFVLATVDYARSGITAAAVAFGGLGAGTATFVVAVLSGRVRRGRLTLSPEGIEQRGWTFSSFLPWEAFAGVKAACTRCSSTTSSTQRRG